MKGDEPFLDREAGQAGDAMDVELAHDAFAMGFDRAHAHAKASGDFFVAEAFGDSDENLAFAVTHLARAGSFTGAANELIQSHAGDLLFFVTNQAARLGNRASVRG